jgi:putative component of membrane protein insertase Oxa1/YidC/SpoIIIJ protein YidD
MRALVAGAITLYQRHLSPRKGFCCAHRQWYGRESCSEHIKAGVLSHGVLALFSIARKRFADCREAHHVLKTVERKETKPKERSQESCFLPIGGEDLACIACECLPDIAPMACDAGQAMHCGCLGF